MPLESSSGIFQEEWPVGFKGRSEGKVEMKACLDRATGGWGWGGMGVGAPC